MIFPTFSASEPIQGIFPTIIDPATRFHGLWFVVSVPPYGILATLECGKSPVTAIYQRSRVFFYDSHEKCVTYVRALSLSILDTALGAATLIGTLRTRIEVFYLNKET